MRDIIKTIKSLGDLGFLIDKVKHEIKQQKGRFLGALLVRLAALLVQTVIPSVVKGINWRVFRRAGAGYINKNF